MKVDKSAYSGTEHLESSTTAFQYYEQRRETRRARNYDKLDTTKLVELERKQHKLEQYLRRECLDFSDIPSSVAAKDLENVVLRLLQEIGVDLDKSRIAACHRLGKTHKTIVKFLNGKDAGNVFSNKRKLKDVDISCLLSYGIQDRNDMTTGGQNHWREGGLYRKRKIFISQDLCPYCRYLHGLV